MDESLMRLLNDVSWSFSEPVPQSPTELVEAACAYAVEMGVEDPGKRLLQRLPFSDVRLKYEHAVQTPSGDWQEAEEEVRVVSAQSGRLTGADLLWELHVACASTVGGSDRHFFEGLELEHQGAERGPPTYRVVLGS